jgi:hypothetical protein
MSARPLVIIGTPCFGAMLSLGYVQSLIELTRYAPANGFDVDFTLLGNDALITRCRNTIVSQFLKHPQATHLLFVDSDITFRPEHVARLLQADKDLVAGMYPLKALDWTIPVPEPHPAFDTVEELALHYVGRPLPAAAAEWDGPFVTGDYAGTGFMMMTRAMVERMVAAYPDLCYSGIHTYPRLDPTPSTQYALFECMIDPETKSYLSEDYAFCWRWRRLGGKIWLDTEGRLTHVGHHAYHGNPAQRFIPPGGAPTA